MLQRMNSFSPHGHDCPHFRTGPHLRPATPGTSTYFSKTVVMRSSRTAANNHNCPVARVENNNTFLLSLVQTVILPNGIINWRCCTTIYCSFFSFLWRRKSEVVKSEISLRVKQLNSRTHIVYQTVNWL